MSRWLWILIFFSLLSIVIVGVWQWPAQKNLIDPAWFGNTPLESWSSKLLDVGEVFAPEPLLGPLNQPGSLLAAPGILAATNRHRAIYDLAPLQPNLALDQAAQKKVADMFARQYFAHEAPDGDGPADLVTSVQYQYVRVGENLALGNFASDMALVQAWMDSPGHRENILHKGFYEIGLAAGEGTFEGTRVWLAVQTFAAPLSSCPAVNPALQNEFDRLKSNLDQLSQNITAQQVKLAAEEENINVLAQEIKELAETGNNKIKEGNEKIQQGNEVLQNTNDPSKAQPSWDQGEQLQAEGQALLEVAGQRQSAYDTRAKDYDSQLANFNSLAQTQRQKSETMASVLSQLNQQIRAFNECLK